MEYDFKRILRYESLVIILVLGLVFVFDFYPLMNKVVELRAEVGLMNADSSKSSGQERDKLNEEADQRADEIEKDFRVVKESVQALSSKATREKNIPLVTMGLEDLASSLNIELNSIRPMESEVIRSNEVVPIELAFQSEYVKLIQFLTKLDGLPMSVAVKDLSITKDANQEALNIRLVLELLFNAPQQ